MTPPTDPSPFRPFSQRALWIWSAEATHMRRNGSKHNSAFEVRFFRKTFTLEEKPRSFAAAISADGRYVLYFNGHRIGRGPAKGDVHHQFYETYDLTPWVRAGENILAVRVVDYSPVRCYPPLMGAPASVMTSHGGFAFDGRIEGTSPQRVVSDETWRVWTDESLEFAPDAEAPGGFVGYFEKWHAQDAELGWQQLNYDHGKWAAATELYSTTLIEDVRDNASPYGLLPRVIKPCREGEPQTFAHVFLPGGGDAPPAMQEWAAGRGELVCRPGESVSCLLDAGRLETGFPQVKIRGGAGATVRITYAEALRLSANVDSPFSLHPEGNLASVALGRFSEDIVWSFDRRGTLGGLRDVILPDGRPIEFEPTHWRTFRYIQLEVTAGEKEIALSPLTYRFYAYPIDLQTTIDTTRDSDRKLWEISVRTLQLCCHETFEDCPYYEQLQYSGDSLITSRLLMYLTGDSAMTRQALHHFAWSITSEGVTCCRYPCTLLQVVIPSWSLHWITMVHDYVLFTGDRALGQTFLPIIDLVLGWFRRHGDADGLPGKLPYWNCVDWTPGWERGQPPGWKTGVTCAIACQFVNALREVATLREWCAAGHSAELREEARKCAEAIDRRFWNDEAGCYRDAETETPASILANAWAICAGVVPKAKEARVAKHLSSWSPANASYFGMFWVFRARRLLGQNEWWQHLAPWEKLLDTGLTTWPEDTSFWRSMCHAWSAHPIAEYIEGVLGLRIDAPGWNEVTLAPTLGALPQIDFRLCTPHGEMSGRVAKTDSGLRFDLTKPRGVALKLVFGAGSLAIDAGEERVSAVVPKETKAAS